VTGSTSVDGSSRNRTSLPRASGVAPLATMAVMSEPVAMSMRAALKVGSASSAATEMARVATPGVPVMYADGPSFPDETTTVTPARAALSTATASMDPESPKDEPSDRLMTSAPALTARSMASTTR